MPDLSPQHWRPFTANRDFQSKPRLFASAEGVTYVTPNKRRVLDGVSGLFCCAAGHGHAKIADAVGAQLRSLDYAPHFQFGHSQSELLAERLSALLPAGVDHVFFGNSGSEAVDSALKIAIAYQHAIGQSQRTRIVSRQRAYHGANFGGTSVAGLVRNRDVFGPLLAGVHHMRHTEISKGSFTRGQPDEGAHLADDLQSVVELYGNTIAACIVEPIAGSTGCLVPPKGYLDRLRQICDANGIVLIFDEVITGFGRTGKGFASETFNVVPDMITMAKALTNGTVPMGAVGVHSTIYDAVVNSAPEGGVELYHGYTYSANPSSCAAALATLDIYEELDLFNRAEAMAPTFLDAVFSLRNIDAIADIRGFGMLAGIDLAPQGTPGSAGARALKEMYDAGLLIKATGDTFLLAPPLVTDKSDLASMIEIVRSTLSKWEEG